MALRDWEPTRSGWTVKLVLRVRDREVGMTSEHCDYECIDCILFHAKGRLYKSSCEGDTGTSDPPLVDQVS